MKAHSMGVEFTFELSKDEVSRLEYEVLSGNLKLRNREGFVKEVSFELKVGEIEKSSAFSMAKFIPEDAFYEDVYKMIFVLSEDGYQNLRESGYTGDRSGSLGCTLNFYEVN